MTKESVDKNQLPKDWKWVTFNDVCNKIGDIDHKMPKQIATGYPYVSTKDFTDGLKISFEKAKYISKEDYLNLSRKIKPEKGDIIFPRYGTIGKNILVDFDKEFLVSYSCAVIKPNTSFVIPKYIYLYSLSPRVAKEIEKYVVETTQANIGIASIKSFVFPLPSIPTQQAIVSKIEVLLSELNKGIENLQTAQQQLKIYRHSVLKWAFEGKLTNENLKDGELPNGWKVVTIKEIGRVKGGKRLPKGQTYSEEKTPYPYLRVTDFDNQTISQKKLKFLFPETQLAIKNYVISKDDVFISIAGTIGIAGVIPDNLDGANLTENAAKVCELKNVLNRFLAQFLSSSIGQSKIKESTKTTAQPKLSLFRIEKIELPLPPIEEQHNIVQAIESRLSVVDKMEESITQSLQQAEALRQSILKKAFEGMLI